MGQSDGAHAVTDIFLPPILNRAAEIGGDRENGGVLDGPNGVRIAATEASLAAPLHIIFASPEPLTTTLPLPAQAYRF